MTIQRISGHRDTNATSCPGDGLFSQLGDLRGRVGSVLPVTPAPFPPLATPSRPSRTKIQAAVAPGVVRFGEQPRVQGRLRLLKGDPVGDAPLQVQGLAGRVWRTLATTTSQDDGSFGVGVTASVRRVLRVRFPGDPGRRASTSKQAVVLVRPTIRVRASVRRAPVGRTPVISGRITPAKGGLVLVAERRVGRRWARVQRHVLRVRRGSFRKAVRLARPGLHRVIVVFGGDAANLGVGASPVYVRATSGRARSDPGGGAGAP